MRTERGHSFFLRALRNLHGQFRFDSRHGLIEQVAGALSPDLDNEVASLPGH